jgi:uncharacterized protein DUF4349
MTRRSNDRAIRIPRLAIALTFLLLVPATTACAGAPAAGQQGRTGSEAGAPAASAAPALPGGQRTGTDGGDPAAPLDDARIVRTGSMSVQVQDVVGAVTAAGTAIDGLGGYVGASRQAIEDEHPIAQISYRIPTDRWDDALIRFRSLGTVIDEQTDSVEVTGQLVDLAARIANLRASERALQQIASTTTRVTDVLEVQSRLFQVRGEIEQLSAQQAHLEDQASYGTLTVTYGLEVVAITEAAKGWSAGEEVDQATASLVDILQGLGTAGIWFAIVWLPILVVLVILALATLIVLRRLGIVRRPAAPSPTVPTAPA